MMHKLSRFIGTVGMSLLGMVAMVTTAPVTALAGSPQAQSECEAAASYTFTPIDVPGAIGYTAAFGINARGQIVGAYFNGTGVHGFLDDAGEVTTLDVPFVGAFNTAALGINARGQIVGNYYDSNGLSHGFLYDVGVFTPIDVPSSDPPPSPFTGALGTAALDMNARGQIVGNFLDSTGAQHGFLYDAGRFTSLDDPAPIPAFYGINERGQIVGNYPYDPNFPPTVTEQHGFLYDVGVFSPIDFPGASLSGALGINASGQIVGFYFDSFGGLHGYLYDAGVFTPINVPDAADSEALGINARGQIVGDYSDSTGIHGFVATPKPHEKSSCGDK